MTERRAPYVTARPSYLEANLLYQIKAAGLPEPVREFVFARPRRWRFDLCWPDKKLAVEINGAIYANGRHSRGSGLIGDYEKLNTAQLLEWRVLQFAGPQIEDGSALAMIEQALEAG